MANQDMTYEEALHAMQSGVAFEQGRGSDDGSPKHLRVGVNSAMSDHAALAKLLMNKGFITEKEYAEAVRQEMIREVKRYEKHLQQTYGIDITLG